MFRIALTNLGKYNEGILAFKWLDLPATDEEIETAKEAIGIDDYYEEWFITDYENDYNVRVGEYEDLDCLNEMAEELEALDKREAEIFACLIENGYNYDQAMRHYSDCMVYDECFSMKDVAEQYIENSMMFNEIPEYLRYLCDFFDYESYGDYLESGGEFYYMGNGKYLEVLR